jgi:hypothetical protein
VSEELAVALADAGAILINSLRFLRWGDIDHLIIGPGGITVVDAKNWSGEVNVAEGIPRVGTRKKYDKLDGLIRQQAGVRLALAAARPDLRNTNVQAVMCFADNPSRPAASCSREVLRQPQSAAVADSSPQTTSSTSAPPSRPRSHRSTATRSTRSSAAQTNRRPAQLTGRVRHERPRHRTAQQNDRPRAGVPHEADAPAVAGGGPTGSWRR